MTQATPDSVTFGNPTRTAEHAISVIDALQFLPSNDQYHALACVFMTACDALGLNPRDELERVPRLMRDAEKNLRPEFKAVRAYLADQLGQD